MSGLLYREDMDEVRQRLTTWWNGGDIGRPAMHVTAPREEPLEKVEPVPTPAGWTSQYSTADFDYRVYLAKAKNAGVYFLGESVPFTSPDLAPNCLALFLGCHGLEMPGTVWCEPVFDDPADARFVFDPDNNFYWQFSQCLAREELRTGKGKWLVQFPDLIEGLDTLAALYGTENLLQTLITNPDWVHDCMRQITDRYFQCYDILYDQFRDEVGGTYFWAWAPGRMVKLQCDFSAMIGPDTFGEFMVPVLSEMTERISYSMYHWDGPGALAHHDHLLSIPGLDMLQWTPGTGVAPTFDECWWPIYHKSVEAGKKLLIQADTIDRLKALKKEFGPKLKEFLIAITVRSPREAEEAIAAVSE